MLLQHTAIRLTEASQKTTERERASKLFWHYSKSRQSVGAILSTDVAKAPAATDGRIMNCCARSVSLIGPFTYVVCTVLAHSGIEFGRPAKKVGGRARRFRRSFWPRRFEISNSSRSTTTTRNIYSQWLLNKVSTIVDDTSWFAILLYS